MMAQQTEPPLPLPQSLLLLLFLLKHFPVCGNLTFTLCIIKQLLVLLLLRMHPETQSFKFVIYVAIIYILVSQSNMLMAVVFVS